MNDFPDDGNGYSSDIHYQHERMKELACINRVTQILKENKPVDDTLMNLVLELPTALQYPDYTV
ncbi:MAG: hypothetical protein GX622_00660, partial [Bacteroidales bacterium]|nr:hypothetical protein [Bacteroidales bacterium]